MQVFEITLEDYVSEARALILFHASVLLRLRCILLFVVAGRHQNQYCRECGCGLQKNPKILHQLCNMAHRGELRE